MDRRLRLDSGAGRERDRRPAGAAVLRRGCGAHARSRGAAPAGPARGALGLAAALTLLCGAGALLLPYRPTLNFDQASLADAELLYHAEGVQNTIDVVRARSGATSLVIGGNVEADDGYRQRRHFVLKGHLPLLLLPEPTSVLVVGLGMGITLQATARHPGLERIEVVELSPEHLGRTGAAGGRERQRALRIRAFTSASTTAACS